MHHPRWKNLRHEKTQKAQRGRGSCRSCAFLWLIQNHSKVDKSFPSDYCFVSPLVSALSTAPKEVQMTRTWFMQIAVVVFAAIVLSSLAGMHAQAPAATVAI